MIVNLYINKEQIMEEDSSLSYGHMEFNNLVLFDKKKCILLIAVIELYDKIIELEKKNKPISWFVSDNGEEIILDKIKDKLIIKYFNLYEEFNFFDFKNSYLQAVRSLRDYLLLVNPEIKKEAAFIDLNNISK